MIPTNAESDGLSAATEDRDERLGEAIEEYLALAETGTAPDPESFAARFPDLGDDLAAALEGLAMVQGLVGDPTGLGSRLEAGRRIAGYRIVRELGRGGMGIVYEAVHVDLDRPVALKVLGTHAAPDGSGRRRFLNEAKTAAGLHHTHIVPVFDVGQMGGLCYYAMQRIEGSGLDRVVRSMRKGRSSAAGSGTGKPAPEFAATVDLGVSSLGDPTRSWFGGGSGRSLPREEHAEDESTPFDPPRGSEFYRWVARLGQQAADALAHAHRRGVIHRDVKPSNLLVDARGTVWVADFGLARRLADPSQTQADSMLGTPRYMSPEQAKLGPIDGRTDVYSLGATLYELVTLRPPFDGRTAAELVGQINSREPVPPRKHTPKLPRDLETIVMKAMAKRPGDRYAGAAELAEDLGRFLATEPVKARRIGPVGRAWRFARRHPGLSIVSAAASVAVLSTATVAYVRVLDERNAALDAKAETQTALIAVQKAQLATEAAMRRLLLDEASILRYSNSPDRRKTGLNRLKQAADLGPNPDLRRKLRDEAVEFLSLRDVEARPALNSGRAGNVTFVGDADHLATLSWDGDFTLWDVKDRSPIAWHPLAPNANGPEGQNRPPSRPGNDGAAIAKIGQLLAVVRPDRTGVRLFDSTTGAPFADLATPDRRISALYATPSGHRLVTVSRLIDSGDAGRDTDRVELWNPGQMERPLAELKHDDPVNATEPRTQFGGPLLIECGADDRTVATRQPGSTSVSIWDAQDGRFRGGIDVRSNPTAVAVGPGGMLAVAAGGSIQLWDLETFRPRPGINPHQPLLRSLQFSPDGRTLAAAGFAAGVELWAPGSNTLVAAFDTAERVFDLAFSPDGLALATVGENGARVWTIAEPLGHARLTGEEGQHPHGLAFGPNGTLATTFRQPPPDAPTTLRIWSPDQCAGDAEVWDDVPGWSLGFDAQGRLLIPNASTLRLVTYPDRTSEQVVDLPKAIQPPPSPGNPGPPPGPGSGPGGRGFVYLDQVWSCLRSADGRTFALPRLTELLVWRMDDPGKVVRLDLLGQAATRASRPQFWRFSLSPTGDRIYYVSTMDRRLRAATITGGVARDLGWPSDLLSEDDDPSSLAVSPDGQTVAVGRRSGDVTLIGTERGQVVGTLRHEDEPQPISSLAYSPNGRLLAVGTRAGEARLWSIGNRQQSVPLVRLPGHHGDVRTLSFDDQGKRLAVADDTGVDLWNLERIRSELERLGLGW